MKLEVSNLITAPFGQKESFNVELFNEEIDEEILAERTKGTVELTRMDEEIMAHFKGAVKVKITCDRCLADFTAEIPLNFRQEYLLDPSQADFEKLAVEKGGKIDVTEPIRQEIITHLPVKKLCQEDCQGLCPSCGKNLNVEKCKCKKKVGENGSTKEENV
jgi:uncharacterized protein